LDTVPGILVQFRSTLFVITWFGTTEALMIAWKVNTEDVPGGKTSQPMLNVLESGSYALARSGGVVGGNPIVLAKEPGTYVNPEGSTSSNSTS